MIYAGRPRYGARGCPRQPRSSAIFACKSPPVYEPWRSFKENDEPRVGLPAHSSSSSFSFPSRIRDNPTANCATSISLEILRRCSYETAIYESLYCRWGVVLLGFLGNSIGGETLQELSSGILMEFAVKWKDFCLLFGFFFILACVFFFLRL